MLQERALRIEHNQKPLLPVAGVHAGLQGADPPGVRENGLMGKSEIWID